MLALPADLVELIAVESYPGFFAHLIYEHDTTRCKKSPPTKNYTEVCNLLERKFRQVLKQKQDAA